MSASPYDRKFGIEFEFSCPSIGKNTISKWSLSRYDEFRQILKDNEMEDFAVGMDGSEWEVKTPVLKGSYGLKRAKEFLNLILELGAHVSLSADGLHVHHDAPEFINNPTLIRRLVKNWYHNQSVIMEMAHRCRNNRGACPTWTYQDVVYLESGGRVSGRKNLNVNSLTRHGTIEIRLHEGTLDYDEVFSWVRFGQAFIAKAVEDINTVDSPNELMKRINISRNAGRSIARKIEKYNKGYGTVWA